jgi:serine acetyltransferase
MNASNEVRRARRRKVRRSDAARVACAALLADARRLVVAAKARNAAMPALTALSDASLWALALLRGSSALEALVGSSCGLRQVLRLAFHIDVWTNAIGGGLRLPHPFQIVIGDGVTIGEGCTILHGTTFQRGGGTRIGDGAVIANGVTILAGAEVGAGALVGASSVVRGIVPRGMVAVGAPARVIRPVTRSHTAVPKKAGPPTR